MCETRLRGTEAARTIVQLDVHVLVMLQAFEHVPVPIRVLPYTCLMPSRCCYPAAHEKRENIMGNKSAFLSIFVHAYDMCMFSYL
jgi:hypothetical protein